MRTRGVVASLGLLLLALPLTGAVGLPPAPLAAHAMDGVKDPAACPLAMAPRAPPGGAEAINLLDACSGAIRPGARLSNGCTMNFVFTDAAANLYIGTAGHCTSSVGQSMSAPSPIGTFGTVVFRVNGGIGNDFALIKVNDNRKSFVNATLCGFGGPTAPHSGSSSAGTVLYEYGWGVATQFTSASRARVLVGTGHNANSAGWVGPGSGGDSGAPLITEDGEAYAIHTHGITPVAGVVGESGTYIQRVFTLLGNANINVTLVPAPFTP